MSRATQHCRLSSTEDIYDSHGLKLWAAAQSITPELMTKLADRELRKPLEVCVCTLDPVKEAALDDIVVRICQGSPALATLLDQHLIKVRELLHTL